MVLSSQGFVHKRHLKYQNVFTLAPNSTRFAKFCTDLATNISVLAAIGDGESEMILNIRGFRMAGQISRRKTKPLNRREIFFFRKLLYMLHKNNKQKFYYL